jgi:hypothetical protein
MSTPNDALASRVSDSFHKLSAVASDLNAASDELGKFIGALDASIRDLNLGIESWVSFRHENDEIDWDSDDVGYAKIDRRWGLAIRTMRGNINYPEHDRVESWLFNDSPRALRIQAIGKIPDLLDELAKAAVETTKRIAEKSKEAQQLVTAIRPKPISKPQPISLPQPVTGELGSMKPVPLADLMKPTAPSRVEPPVIPGKARK